MTVSRTDSRPWAAAIPASRPGWCPILYALAWAIFIANMGIVVWLWATGGGISAVHDLGTLWTSIGRITGLLGAYLLLIQLLLLARIPPIVRALGFDHLTVWHRRNGKLALYLVLAHVVFITLGYEAMDRISLGGEIQSLLTNYPGMVEATVGTVLMALIVVSSLVIVRKRFRYEYWYLVHLTAYAAILLGWFHQLPTGNEFVLKPGPTMYWTALYLATLGLLILLRLIQPALMSWRYGLRVEEVVHEAPGVVSIRMSGKRLQRMHAQGG